MTCCKKIASVELSGTFTFRSFHQNIFNAASSWFLILLSASSPNHLFSTVAPRARLHSLAIILTLALVLVSESEGLSASSTAL